MVVKIKKIQITKKVDFADVVVNIIIDSLFELRARLTSGAAEPELVDYIKAFSRGSIFYDIGANVGTFSIYADKMDNGISVYAFEPNAFSFAKLVKNVHLNHCENVNVFPIAISNVSKCDVLYIPSTELGTATCQFGDKNYLKDGFEVSHGIFGSTIDDLVFNHNFPKPDYIKIDIDGLEMQVIEGMKKLLSLSCIQSIFVEVNGHQEKEIANVLKPYGFVIDKRFVKNPKSYNCIFTNKNICDPVNISV
jgi:FkbM family methyltransferase